MSDNNDNKKMTFEEKKALFDNMEVTYTSKKIASGEEVAKAYLEGQYQTANPQDAANPSDMTGAVIAAGLSVDAIKSMAADELISKAAEHSPELQKTLGVLDQVGIDLSDPSTMDKELVKANLQNIATGKLEEKLEEKLAEHPKVKEAMGVLEEVGVDLSNPGNVDKALIQSNLETMATAELTNKLAEKNPKAAEALGALEEMGLAPSLGASDALTNTPEAPATPLTPEPLAPETEAEPEATPAPEKKPPRVHEAMMALNQKNIFVLAQRQTLDLSLTYDDIESTPAGNVPYRITFDNGEVREGVLDEKGQSQQTHVPNTGWELEYCPIDDEDALKEELKAGYQALDNAIGQYTRELVDAHQKEMDAYVKAQQPWTSNTLAYLKNVLNIESLQAELQSQTELSEEESIRRELTKYIEAEIQKLKAESAALDSQEWHKRLWEYTKSAGDGAVNAVADYIPDFGEVGELLKLMEIDVDVLYFALQGDVDALEKAFKDWAEEHRAEYQEASENMEILILLLTDEETRKLLLSIPQRYLEAMPADKRVQYGVSIGVQWVGDQAVIGGLTHAGSAIPYAGKAAGAVVGIGITTLRKVGKAMEPVTKVLMELVKVIKKLRNRRKKLGNGNQSRDKTPLDKKDSKGKDDEKNKSVLLKTGKEKNTEVKAAGEYIVLPDDPLLSYDVHHGGYVMRGRTFIYIHIDYKSKAKAKNNPAKLDSVVVSSTYKDLCFYTQPSGGKKYKSGEEIPIKDLEEEINYPKEYGNDKEKSPYRLYLSYQGKDLQKEVTIKIEIKGKPKNDYKIKNREQTIKVDCEDFDHLLRQAVSKEWMSKIVTKMNPRPQKPVPRLYSLKDVNQKLVAIAKAGLHKNGAPTFDHYFRHNIFPRTLDKAMELIAKKDSNGIFQPLPSGSFNSKIQKEYFRLLTTSKQFKQGEIHPIIKNRIIQRIKDIQAGVRDYESGNRTPGFHAEVFTTNAILLRYFPKETDEKVLQRITVVVGYLRHSVRNKKLAPFVTCNNCRSILSGARIYTNKMNNQDRI